MSASVLTSRRSALLAQGASRKSCLPAFRSRIGPKPFSSGRQVSVKVTKEASAEDEVALISVEEDDNALGPQIELDADTMAAIASAKEIVSNYDNEVVHEVDMADAEVKGRLEARAAAAFDRVLSSSSAELALGIAGSDVPEVDGMEDYQGPHGFRKYDEDADAGISEDQKAAIAQYKLTKNELLNLVPKDWDTINIDWFSSKREDTMPLPEFKLNFLWLEKNIGVAVDQIYSRGQVSPLTEYFIWPRKDAWEELKNALETKPHIAERDKVILLNRLTEVINFWQGDDDVNKPTVDEARASFPDCSFGGL